MTTVLIRRENVDTAMDTPREKNDVKRNRKKMAICKPRRDTWNRSFPHISKKDPTQLTPWSWVSSLQNCEIINVLSHPDCDTWLWKPEQTNTPYLWKPIPGFKLPLLHFLMSDDFQKPPSREGWKQCLQSEVCVSSLRHWMFFYLRNEWGIAILGHWSVCSKNPPEKSKNQVQWLEIFGQKCPFSPPEEVIRAKNLRLRVKPEKKVTYLCGAFNILPVAQPERPELKEVGQSTKKFNPVSAILWLSLWCNKYPPWLNKEFPRTLYSKVSGMIGVTPWNQGQACILQNSWLPAIQCCPC